MSMYSSDKILLSLIQGEARSYQDESGAVQGPLGGLGIHPASGENAVAIVRQNLGDDYLRKLYERNNAPGSYDKLVNAGSVVVQGRTDELSNTFGNSFGEFVDGAFNSEEGGGWGWPIVAAFGAAAGAGAGAAGETGAGMGAAEAGGSYGAGGYTTQAAGAYGGAGASGAGVGVGESVSGSYPATQAELSAAGGSSGANWGDWNPSDTQFSSSYGNSYPNDPYNLGVDQYGNPTGQYADSTFQGGQPDLTNYGGNSQSLLQQAQDLSKQLGISPSSAITLLKNALGGGAAGGANGAGGGLGGILGNLLGAGFGAYASNQQANSLNDLANKYMSFGAPSRARYEASYAPGFTMANDPGYTDALNASSKATLHGLSVQGNPAGSPNAWNQSLSDINSKFAYPALQRYREQNANTGGIGTLTAAAPAAASGAIAQQGNVYNAIGGGLSDIFNPPKSLAQQWAEMMGK